MPLRHAAPSPPQVLDSLNRLEKAQSRRPPDFLSGHAYQDGKCEYRGGDFTKEADLVCGVCGAHGGYETAEVRDVRRIGGGRGLCGGDRKTSGWGVPLTISEFSASTPTGRMMQNDRTGGGVFHGKMDRCRGTQGWTTACSGMHERDGKDKGKDIPKQASLCRFACPC